MTNQLESLLVRVKAFNASADEFAKRYAALSKERAEVEAIAKELGLHVLKVRAMLAKTTVKITMPDEWKPEAAEGGDLLGQAHAAQGEAHEIGTRQS